MSLKVVLSEQNRQAQNIIQTQNPKKVEKLEINYYVAAAVVNIITHKFIGLNNTLPLSKLLTTLHNHSNAYVMPTSIPTYLGRLIRAAKSEFRPGRQKTGAHPRRR